MPRLAPLVVLVLLAACDNDDEFDVSGRTIDGIFLPAVDAVSWADAVDNRFFPLPVGATWSYSSETADGLETAAVEVLADTKEIESATATVVHDTVYLDGVLIEDTFDWYAQDTYGNVWYLGEDTCEVEDGQCVRTEGSWEWGVDGALPGVIMWNDPQVTGQPYFQEYAPGNAEDVGEVLALDDVAVVPAGAFTGCVRTADTSHLDDTIHEEKLYAPDVGNVETFEGDTEEVLEAYDGL